MLGGVTQPGHSVANNDNLSARLLCFAGLEKIGLRDSEDGSLSARDDCLDAWRCYVLCIGLL